MKSGMGHLLISIVLLLLQGHLNCLLLEAGKAEVFTGRCSLFGDDHIQTFDGTFYDFPGDCSYMMAGDCEKRAFSILGDFQHGKKKSVSLYLGEYIDIHLSVDGAVMRGEKRIHLPYASNGIFIEPEAGHVKLSSEEYGFMVRVDTTGNIQVFLSSDHMNKTCGLCGNFNSLSEDEFMSQEEFLVKNSYDFANSWAVHGTVKRCRRVSPPSKTCNISSDLTGEDFVDHCQLLMTSPEFFKCHHRVDPEPFIAVCESDMCSCGDTKECRCQAFLEYARTCAQHGYILRDWTKQSACGVACPAGMEYSECISPCTKTCQSLNINEVCEERCIDGCRCPEDKVLDGDHCVDISDCSCIHNGKHYEPGSSISRDCNSCICRHGMWVCTNEDCPGECFISGQSHFKSFDNKHFTFSGVCHYLFAKEIEDNSFAVTIETVQCADDPDAVCVKSASVRLQDMDNMIIKLKHGGGVAVDGQDIQTPMIQGALRIQRLLMSSVRLIYNNDIQIDWDGHGRLTLKLSPTYKGLTSGLCGNYNGNQGDDFRTPSGLVEVQVEDFGNAWKLSGECLDVTKQDLDPCSLNPKRARYAEDVCSVVMSSEFEVCHHEVNPGPYLKNCRYDVCACSDSKECLCSSISTYAMACARKGVVVNWRTPDFCAMHCPKGEEYQQCGSPCNQTCRSLSFPNTDCSEFCMEGCYCPAGLYRLETGECVPKADCSCYYDGEIFQPNDLFSNHLTMCYCENGVMHCSSSDVPGAYLPDLYLDTRPAFRGKRSLTCTPPFEKYICPEDNPRAVGTECAKTCKNYRLECISHGCISGCMCPTGLVRHENTCIPQSKCPCFHNGKEYAQGEKINIDCNTCVCHKWKWDCTNMICDGSCTAIGEANYLTFDKTKYMYPGPCQYVLVQDYCRNKEGTFRILVENEGCGYPGEKCVKRILVLYRKGEIELADKKVVVRKQLQDDTGVETIQSGRYYILLLGNGVTITWDKAAMVTVHLKGKYRDKVCGLCGNFDGIQNNDMMSSQNQLQAVPSDFGNSWKVHAQCADAEMATPPCADNMMKQMQVENACNILRSDTFKECKGVVNPEPYWDICVYDTCACESIGDCACFCDALAAYAYECAQQGVPVHWRSSSLCPLNCEEKNHIESDYKCEWKYNTCSSACPITCQHPEPLDCIVKCVEGCHANCPAGRILDEVFQQCIDAEHCSVCVISGKMIPPGKKIYKNKDDPTLCQTCVCNNTVLSCVPCLPEELTTPPPETTTAAPTLETVEEPVPEDACSRMMDLAFIVDGSSKMSEKGFEMVKDFIVAIMEHFHIDQNRIRVAAMQYSSDLNKGSASQYKSYVTDIFQLINGKRPSQLKQLIREMKYIGAAGSDIGEALKFVSVHIFNRARRFNAPKVVVLLTASASVRDIKSLLSYWAKQKIVLLSLGIGPNINKKELNLLIDQSLEKSRAIFLDSSEELTDQVSEITYYLCNQAEPFVSQVTEPPVLLTKPTALSTAAGTKRLFYSTTLPPPTSITIEKQIIDMVIVIEGSKNVGKDEFEENKKFIEQVVNNLDVGEETVHITILQYSYTVTVEYSFTDTQTKEEIIKAVRQMEFQNGNATNTGKALNYVKETTLNTPESNRELVPNLVFLVASNPATDVITKPPDAINIIPIATTPQVNVKELELIGKPILLNRYNISTTIQNVLKEVQIISKSSTLQPEAPCKKPMDVIFLLDGSSMVSSDDFEEMKNFVKLFIKGADIGHNATQVAVLQYGHSNSLEITWTDAQTPESLLHMVTLIQQEQTGANHIGKGLLFASQSAVSEHHGGRPGVPKIAVIIVMGPSPDAVETAAYAASMEDLLVFPIAIGNRYNDNELETLTGQSNRGNIIKLSDIHDLPTMVSLKNDFIDKLCKATSKVCRDENGNERKPGDTWMLADKCHTVTCLPDGETRMQSHRINCEKVPKPECHNNLPSVKVEETCGCRWACPCICMGSSTKHIVTFDGASFKLLGNCSYTLFLDTMHDTEVTLHNGPCRTAPTQTCMTSIEVRYKGSKVHLDDDMQVKVNNIVKSTPVREGDIEATVYGAIMHDIKITSARLQLTFTPQNNEFTIQQIQGQQFMKTFGLCGSCDQNEVNDFMLRNGSVSLDHSNFVNEWTIKDIAGKSCNSRTSDECMFPVSEKCMVLLSSLFQKCHEVIPPAPYLALCKDSSCHGEDICDIIAAYGHTCRIQGICVNWRSSSFCGIECPGTMQYDFCSTSCMRQCDSVTSAGANRTQCTNAPNEGCFCPEGKVLYNGECVTEDVCTQCIDEHGGRHQLMETWIPAGNPCQICICLENRRMNCTTKPCATAAPPVCAECEIPRLRKTSDQCCSEYECLCDLASCHLPPIPHCEDGLSPVLLNPGECKSTYGCACKRETCPLESPPLCPHYKTLKTMKTQCCDKYECVCNCINSTVTCPTGYQSDSTMNDCGCITTRCIPEKVCVRQDVTYHVGSTWEENCKQCTCTSREDEVTGLYVVECIQKQCNEICPVGYVYTKQEGLCCGKCTKSACQEEARVRGDDVLGHTTIHVVGDVWKSPSNPCVINECIQVNGEAFVQQSNVSCGELHVPKCPLGFELQCKQITECCPSCECVPVHGCIMNGTIIGAGEMVLVDECTRCQCNVDSSLSKFRLMCGKASCPSCPEGYEVEKTNGSCCGTCAPSACTVKLTDGRVITLQPNTTIKDGCRKHTCKMNVKGGLVWEQMIQECQQFDRVKCLEEGGKVVPIGDTCCETCIEAECRQTTGILKHIQINDCITENPVDINYCEGKCTTKSIYSLEKEKVEDQCICCSATRTNPKIVSLRCTNGTMVQHRILNAVECECLSHRCESDFGQKHI
ncbi:von Willebrand factor [Protopterus annectens]|uniref:von Willebrand factor n=1 Tax=Protopterus annectens TaxID=7888 RepID=UPI001CFBC03D|nr:von Willebrand factor [Protopterus annectens]